MRFLHCLYYIDDNSYLISIGITVYLVYYNWSLIKNNTHKEILIW